MNCRPEDMLLYAVTDRAWLKGETLEIAEEEACFSGWTLVLNDGYPLGFGKLNKGTLKNKYCSGWRLL